MIRKSSAASRPSSPRPGIEPALLPRGGGEVPVGAFPQNYSRIPFYLNGRITLAVLTLYITATLVSYGFTGRLGHAWMWAAAFITPFNHVATVTLLAPYPWLLGRHRSSFRSFVQGLFLSLVACELAVTLIVLLDAWLVHQAGLPTPRLARLLQVYLIIVGPAMTVLGGLIAARANAEGEKEAIREEAMIARTRLLQSQLHPHVLFNALNGLAELIHKDPPAAERSVGHLANLLRRILRASEQPTLPLGDERSLVEDYLHLESMRLGPRLRVTWDWQASLNAIPVPPLLLQPLVENAIKHGITPNRSGGDLRIRARAQGQDLHLEVWNTGAPFQPGPSEGVGLRNLEARLVLMYGPAARLTHSYVEEGILAAIHLPGALIQYDYGHAAGSRCG